MPAVVERLQESRSMNQQEFNSCLSELTPQKMKVLREFLQIDKDSEIAEKLCIEANTVARHIAETIKIFGLQQDSRERCRPELVELFYQYKPEWVSQRVLDRYGIQPQPITGLQEPPYPGGFLMLRSPFYVKPIVSQKQVLQDCASSIQQQAALLRIKSPRKTGKTSFLERILGFSEEKKGYRVARFSLKNQGQTCFDSLKALLKVFCQQVSNQLGVDAELEEQWDHKLDPMPVATNYFQKHILEPLDIPLVVGLDDIDRLFQYPALYDFFTLLRSWNEETKRSAIWQKFRCVVTYSTDIYIKLDINNSPFNVGKPIELPLFQSQEVQALAQNVYGLRELGAAEIDRLMDLVGGHPYLIQLALYYLAKDEMPLMKLLDSATTQEGIYRSHLQEIWGQIQSDNQARCEIFAALKQLIYGNIAQLTDETGHKLQGLGVIQFDGNEFRLSCELYRQYFEQRLH